MSTSKLKCGHTLKHTEVNHTCWLVHTHRHKYTQIQSLLSILEQSVSEGHHNSPCSMKSWQVLSVTYS